MFHFSQQQQSSKNSVKSSGILNCVYDYWNIEAVKLYSCYGIEVVILDMATRYYSVYFVHAAVNSRSYVINRLIYTLDLCMRKRS